jgi:hypothetical protein
MDQKLLLMVIESNELDVINARKKPKRAIEAFIIVLS